MEDLTAQYDIFEYSVSQTTLEQIFNTFAQMGEGTEGMGVNRKHSLRRRSSKRRPANPATEHEKVLKARE